MVALSTGIALLGAGLSVAGQVGSAQAAKKNAKKQNALAAKDAAAARKQEELRLANARRENDRKRRENLRAFLRQRGDTIGGAANRGAIGSSGVAGAVQGAGAQFASEAGNITAAERITADLGTLNSERAGIATASSTAQASFLEAQAKNKVLQSFGSGLFSNSKQTASVIQSGSGLFSSKG
jgi:hypothetical protein